MFIVFDNTVAFNAELAAKKTFKEFKEHEKHLNIPEEKLKEYWAVCCDAVKQKENKGKTE